jgi:outer membrane lipoprotein-sorting protein
MPRRLASLLAALAVVTSLVAAACSSTPSAPALSDPKEILSQSVAALATAKTFHLKAAVAGSIPLDMTGSGTASPLDLEGTTLEGDMDVAGKKAHLTFAAPALLTTGEVILVDDTTYTKISLMGPKFSKTAGTTGDAEVPTDPAKVITDVKAALDKLPTPPTKNADVKCADTDCYSVTIALTSQDLGTLGGDLGALPSGTAGAGTIELWVRKNDLRPTRVVVTADAGAQGKLTVTLDITNYDASVSIVAPPADQVAG